MEKYIALGVMSGTSLDGLDLALCSFEKSAKGWNGVILQSETFSYEKHWYDRLKNAIQLEPNSEEINSLDQEFGKLIGEKINAFLEHQPVRPDFIASHGHTVFHQPDDKFTFQAGDGGVIQAVTKLPVINDFRRQDVALGGQGAPLVPIVDRMLFSQFDACLNLGGIANISFESDEQRIAFDIAPANMALNYLANQLGHDFDNNGEIAASGTIATELLKELDAIHFYNMAAPKSLGYEDFLQTWLPILKSRTLEIQDMLRTYSFHLSGQIAKALPKQVSSLLVTGGGAFNEFLIDRLGQDCAGVKIEVPSKELIEFKEAFAFAFLGVLRLRREVNCLASVTGASQDNIGGMKHGF